MSGYYGSLSKGWDQAGHMGRDMDPPEPEEEE